MSFWNGSFFWGDMWFSFVGGGGRKTLHHFGVPLLQQVIFAPQQNRHATGRRPLSVSMWMRACESSGTAGKSTLFNLGWSKPMLFLLARSSKKNNNKKLKAKKNLWKNGTSVKIFEFAPFFIANHRIKFSASSCGLSLFFKGSCWCLDVPGS